MAELNSWLQRPLTEGSPYQMWMALAAGSAVLLILTLLFVLLKRRRRSKTQSRTSITEQPEPFPVLEAANLQGIGMREEQQDAFAISPLDRYDQDGLLMVLCDGMGGMAEGGAIAKETASELLSAFPWDDSADVTGWVKQHSRKVYQRFRGQGGTTLVAALVKEQHLQFWCAGDSDLFLLREGKLTALHLSQDYRNELVLKALSGIMPVADAFTDKQAGALSQYIGKDDVKCAYTRIPFRLQPHDTLLLCSDGISNTLTLSTIREALALRAQPASELLEAAIRSAREPEQDNYTAIVMKFFG